MQLHFIRNATIRLTYAGHRILIDPYFAPKHSLDAYVGKSRNPTVDLPIATEDVIADTELLIVSHLHSDHFDSVAHERLPKDLPLYCQAGDEGIIVEKGFQNVTAIESSIEWQGIYITRTPGQHGTGEWLKRMGKTSGFVFKAEGEPTVYFAGDTIWYEGVEQAISDYQPDIIVTHSGGAHFGDSEPIVMDAEQTIATCKAAPNSKIVAVHMEALDHCPLSRTELRAAAANEGISAEQLLIPADGEVLKFS